MTVYFSAAIAQSDRYGKYYQVIVDTIEELGHQVLGNATTISFQDAYYNTRAQRVDYYHHLLHWLGQCDVVVAEVSFPSTINIGHELSLALERNRPVVAVYHTDHEPCLLLGRVDSKIFLNSYQPDTLRAVVKAGLAYAISQLDSRFNFFLSPTHSAHLDEITKRYKIPRAAYVRKLIDDDLRKNSVADPPTDPQPV